jgi:hypothetical protein
MSLTGIPELKKSCRQLGAARFGAIMLGTCVWIGIGAWLQMTNDYPAAYGSSCHRKCLIEDYWYSPELIRHGGGLAYALFAWLWLLPVFVIGVAIWARLRKQGRPRDRIARGGER